MTKAVILAAGRGTRMQGVAGDVPKPLIPLRGKPMIEHILDRLRLAGFQEALIVVGYMGELIERHLAGYPMEVTFRRQVALDGTGRAALLAREWAGSEPFLLAYGDILMEHVEYQRMARRLEEDQEASAVVAVKWVDDPFQGAAVYEDAGRVVRIIEKPAPGTSSTHWNSAGGYAFRREVFDELERIPKSPRGEYELTSAVEQLLGAGRSVLLHAIEGGWRDVGRPTDLEEAEKLLG